MDGGLTLCEGEESKNTRRERGRDRGEERQKKEGEGEGGREEESPLIIRQATTSFIQGPPR